MPDILKLCTMSTEKMLRIAVHEHQKAFYGQLPKRIEMHPAVFGSLANDPHYARSVHELMLPMRPRIPMAYPSLSIFRQRG